MRSGGWYSTLICTGPEGVFISEAMVKTREERCLLKAAATCSLQASSATAGAAARAAIAQITAQRCIDILPLVTPLGFVRPSAPSAYCASGSFAMSYAANFPTRATL